MYVITGASGGMGQKVIEELVNQGKKVVGLYNSNCPKISGAHFVQYDLTQNSENPLPFEDLLTEPINFIHLAGITINRSMSKITSEDIQKQFDVNCLGALNIVRKLWPRMKADGYGRLIFTSSVLARHPVFGALGYTLTKSAIEGAVRGLLPEGIKNNILPFGIGLGYTDYGMIQQVPEKFQEALKTTIPMGRFGNFQEVMNTIDFLINTPYMAGQIVHLNGGLYLA